MNKKLFMTLMSSVILVACGNSEANIDNSNVNAQEDNNTDVDSTATDEGEWSATIDDLEDSYDVIVIGAGGAGMAAAVEAHDAGANVAVFEKMPIVGGNTLKASAGMNAAGSKFQEEQGIEDDPDLFYEETFEAGHEENDPELLRFLVDNSAEGIEWLDSLGIELGTLTFTGGMSVERAHRPTDGSPVGDYLVDGLSDNLEEREVPIFLNSEVTSLIEEDGEVVGISVNLGQTDQVDVEADSIIIASGGFGANFEMIEEFQEDFADMVTTNHEGATGDGIQMAQEVGGEIVDMEYIQVHPTVHQEDGYLISESVRGDGGILVNENGERFIDEMEPRDVVSQAVMEQPSSHAFIIGDQGLRERVPAINHYDDEGLLETAETIEELAEKIGVNPDTLEQTLENWNEAVRNQEDPEFGRSTGMDEELNTGPYFAANIAPGIHHTMGGIRINSNTEVLDEEGNPIPNLYAAGEVTGGLHGANRVGGNAVADIVVFGRQAGAKATENAE